MNGENAIEGSNPWMAILLKPAKDGQPPEFFCAGTLIDECFVLTAAHCVFDKQQIIVRLGDYDRSSENNATKEDIYVIEAHVHHEFVQMTNLNDIALLRLSRCVSYKAHVQPICIQMDPLRKSQLDSMMQLTAVGWGNTRTGKKSDVLQTVTLKRLLNGECKETFWKNDTTTQFCAGDLNDRKVDSCEGDSGGPLYTTGLLDGVIRKTQVGIISYGTTTCHGVGVYTDVMSYVDWIEKIVFESDSVLVVPKINFLDDNCISNSTTLSGRKSQTSAFPWLAHVYIDSFPLALGTLISDSFVISTAQFYPAGVPLKVGLGRNSGHSEMIYNVESVIRRPDFASLSKNDIALLKLAVKVQFSDNIRPICMPGDSNETTTFQEKALQMEHLEAIGSRQESSAIVQRLNSTICYKGNYQKLDENQICFRHPQLISLASGSPLVRKFAHGDAFVYTLVGMASFGHSDLRGPDVYTDVLSYSKWIEGLIR
ncbi:uncharacterized protein [Drosophila kikkawai]|uniref:Peptidase S1 domain-containing protein n=1 Tax=Drosophila kikkawai TaxID=30033 RepID=A0ABM4GCQ1_DROKI